MATLAGTSSGDFLLPTANGTDYRGGMGSDTYILTPLIPASAVVSIIDTEGANKVQLAEGLVIASSSFFADAVQLTLSNGAIIKVLGASKFTFDIGANAAAADTTVTTGTTLGSTFAQFAASLGATLPAAGAAAVAGTVNYSTTTGISTTAKSYAVNADSSSFDEGKSATFTVTTANVADNTELAFTLGGTSTAADYTAPATLKVNIVGGKGTIAVPLIADKLTEATAETLSVTLTDDTTKTASVTINDTSMTPTYAIAAAAATADEGANATFTVTTTNVADNTELAFTLGGTSTAADYTAPTTLKVNIVGGKGTIAVPLIADKLTEATAETLSVTLTDDTTKTASVTINDTSTAGGAVAVSAAGSQDASGGDYVFNVAAGNYTYTISGFSSGDKIASFAGAIINIVADADNTDGIQSYGLTDPATGGTVTITLTGLSATQDAGLFNVGSFNTTFGAGSLA